MKKMYEIHLANASLISNSNEKLSYLTSILRSLLQISVVSTLEIIKGLTPADEADLADFTNRFCKPSDGLPIEILDGLVPFVRHYVDNKYLHGWFEGTLSKELLEWVQFRNNHPAHGVLDKNKASEWAEKTELLVKKSIDIFKPILPKIDDTGAMKLSSDLSSLRIETPIVKDGEAIVILSVTTKKGIFKLKAQTLSSVSSEEFIVDLPEDNIFSVRGLNTEPVYALTTITSNNKEHSFYHNIPVRQTNTFEGRQAELNTLQEWVVENDSKYCLLYGDGGFGKTTIVLESLNQLMESQFDFSGVIPSVICYYSAKMTRWNENGLVRFASVNPVMDDCIRELMRVVHPILAKEWYIISGTPLINKAVGTLKNEGFNREDILLIIDNTETLATTTQEVKELGEFFKLVGKLIGRIIITSRRREFVPADPIVVEGLSELDAVNLLKNLAGEYKAIPLLQAGEAKLRRVASQLMRKPLLLEALVKYVSNSKLGIDQALGNIFKKTNEDLLEFLYEDAWRRMSDLQKEMFYVLIHLTSPLDQNSIGQACVEIGIQHSEFHSSLEETYFSVLTERGRTYSLELVELAKRFFLQQFGRLSKDEKDRLKIISGNIDRYATERNKVEKEYIADRVADAFRSEYSKAAKVFADKGDISGAISMYKLALEDDPLNAALHDRFSWLLLNRTNQFLYAKELSERAIELDPSSCDATVGLALVCYRVGDIPNGDIFIDRAKALGRSESFCLLRKAIARYHSAKMDNDLDENILILEEVLEKLSSADRINTRAGGYDAKTLKDIKRYIDLTKSKLTLFRTRKTKSLKVS